MLFSSVHLSVLWGSGRSAKCDCLSRFTFAYGICINVRMFLCIYVCMHMYMYMIAGISHFPPPPSLDGQQRQV